MNWIYRFTIWMLIKDTANRPEHIMHWPAQIFEAGLRTYNIYSPYPEEFNRQAVGIAAQFHFAPTRMAADNLMKEGKDPSRIFVSCYTDKCLQILPFL